MDERETFLRIVESAKKLLQARQAAHGPHATLGAVLSNLAEDEDGALAAETMLSKALERFALHPYLLSWRANARFRRALGQAKISSNDMSFVEPADAVEDLKLASRVAPDYLQPRIDLAFHTLNYADDSPRAVQLFEQLVDELRGQLVQCALGLVDSLREVQGDERAERELQRWMAAFPAEVAAALSPEAATQG